MKLNLSKQKGFTLTELMVVIVIIGVLAAFALPTYQSYVEKTNLAEAKQQITAIYQRIQNEKVANTKKLTDKASYETFLNAALPANKGQKYHFYFDVSSNGKLMEVYFLAAPVNKDYKHYLWANDNGVVLKCKSNNASSLKTVEKKQPSNCEKF
ncbi:MAG: prepilin-type N-terminal cleavage/methylation domain-containing protein [Alysiella sp.]|uniref:type IV pilin protein n=1 Tax=Alysiella sp. TaxID=1872483 RepID=UPI0026DC11C1|nr:prepilin-type N-terminal cleavage/methylation domain-containing protein [Alysiella sp.]MDO4433495.1 prepilin-type N-terminal cleavage/methylation domain-containing protein [Alysiella sp.]